MDFGVRRSGSVMLPWLGPKQFEPVLKLRLRSTRITAVAGTGKPIVSSKSGIGEINVDCHSTAWLFRAMRFIICIIRYIY